jgi:hypothetical protein
MRPRELNGDYMIRGDHVTAWMRQGRACRGWGRLGGLVEHDASTKVPRRVVVPYSKPRPADIVREPEQDVPQPSSGRRSEGRSINSSDWCGRLRSALLSGDTLWQWPDMKTYRVIQVTLAEWAIECHEPPKPCLSFGGGFHTKDLERQRMHAVALRTNKASEGLRVWR